MKLIKEWRFRTQTNEIIFKGKWNGTMVNENIVIAILF
jgi:hypothetical protein